MAQIQTALIVWKLLCYHYTNPMYKTSRNTNHIPLLEHMSLIVSLDASLDWFDPTILAYGLWAPTPPKMPGRHGKLSRRFEPRFLGYDASVLPLNYESELAGRLKACSSPAWGRRALSSSYYRCTRRADTGIRTLTPSIPRKCSTTELCRRAQRGARPPSKCGRAGQSFDSINPQPSFQPSYLCEET